MAIKTPVSQPGYILEYNTVSMGVSMVCPSILVSISQRTISGTTQGITLPREVGGVKFSIQEKAGKLIAKALGVIVKGNLQLGERHLKF
jgi:hypothetical protein